MVSGIVEIWINHYDDAFSTAEVAATPATVDVYCHSCLDEQGDPRQGLVMSVTQQVGNVVAGANWWKVGQFVAPAASDTSLRMQWQACTLGPGCYVAADFAPVTTRRTRRPKGDRKPRLRAANPGAVSPGASSRSQRFGQHDLYRVECDNFVTMHPHLTYKFGYRTAYDAVLFSSSDVPFMDLYLPSGSVEVFISIRDALGAELQYITPSVSVAPVALGVTTIIWHVNSLLQMGSYGCLLQLRRRHLCGA